MSSLVYSAILLLVTGMNTTPPSYPVMFLCLYSHPFFIIAKNYLFINALYWSVCSAITHLVKSMLYSLTNLSLNITVLSKSVAYITFYMVFLTYFLVYFYASLSFFIIPTVLYSPISLLTSVLTCFSLQSLNICSRSLLPT